MTDSGDPTTKSAMVRFDDDPVTPIKEANDKSPFLGFLFARDRGSIVGGIRGYKGRSFLPEPRASPPVQNPNAIVLPSKQDYYESKGKGRHFDPALFMGSGQSNFDTRNPSDHIQSQIKLETKRVVKKKKKKKKSRKQDRVEEPVEQEQYDLYIELARNKKSFANKQATLIKELKGLQSGIAAHIDEGMNMSQAPQRKSNVKKKQRVEEFDEIKPKRQLLTREEEFEQWRQEEEKRRRVVLMQVELERKQQELERLEKEFENEHEQMKEMAQQMLKRLRKIDPRALYIFDSESGCRKLFLTILQNKAFEYLMIAAILGNSLCLALYDFSDPNDTQPRNQVLGKLDITFTGIYTVEAIIKIISLGFVVHRKGYLRDPWNVLDFISLMVSYISLLPNIPNLKMMRVLRVMKPLRSINAIPTMKRLFNTLLMSIPEVGQVMLFLLFIFSIFAILGNELFSGMLYERCRLTQFPTNDTGSPVWLIDNSQQRVCGAFYQCNPGTYCGSPLDYGLPLSQDNQTNYPNLYWGLLPFDNIGAGLLQIIRTITLNGWSQVMYNYQDSVGAASSIYFPVVLVIGGFFLLNLFLAVIMHTFEEMTAVQQKKEQQKREAKLRKQRQGAIKQAASDSNRSSGQSKHQAIMEKMINGNKNKMSQQGAKAKSMADAVLMMIAQNKENKSNQKELDQENDDNRELDFEVAAIYATKNVNMKEEEVQTGYLLPELNEIIHEQPTGADRWNSVRSFLLKACKSKIFQWIITISIIVNTICLAMDKYPPDLVLQSKLDTLNIFFFCVFFTEMTMKLCGMGPSQYVRDQFNIFDAFVVTISIVDIVVTNTVASSAGGGGKSAVSAMRAFRLLRVFKLAKQWTQLQHLLKTIMQSLRDISSFSVLLALLIFIYVLIGLELFSFQLYFDPNGIVVDTSLLKNTTYLAQIGAAPPRDNFDSFFHGFLVVFQILLEDNWDWLTLRFALAKGWIAIAYFFSLYVIGVMFFLNIFMAILLENFGFETEIMGDTIKKQAPDDPSLSSGLESSQHTKSGLFSKLSHYLGILRAKGDTGSSGQEEMSSGRSLIVDASGVKNELVGDSDRSKKNADLINQPSDMTPMKIKEQNENSKSNEKLIESVDKSKSLTLPSPKTKETEDGKSLAQIISKKRNERKKQEILESQNIRVTSQECQGQSLMCFSNNSKVRLFLLRVISHRFFDWFIILLIILSSINLAFDNPLNDPNGSLTLYIFYADVALTSIFAFECLSKIISYGFFFNGDTSYLRIGWNVLDFSIVLFSIVALSFTSVKFKLIKIFRLVRVLRPLRLITKFKMLRIAIQALFKAIPNIFNIIVVSMLFFTIFGILGINFFKGTFWNCQVSSYAPQALQSNVQAFVKTKWDCLNLGGAWINGDTNFDNMGIALQSLYQVASTEGWATVMYQGADFVGVDMNPQLEYNYYWSLFFVFFVIFGNFFLMNLFAGAVVMSFNQEKERLGKTYLLTEKQKRWIEQKRVLLALKPNGIIGNEGSEWRKRVGIIIKSNAFNYIIFVSILANTIGLTVTWYGEPQSVNTATTAINYVCAGVFIIEAGLKLYGYGPRSYFDDKWNQFDFLVVVATVIGEIVTQAGGSRVKAAVTFIRALRVQRLLRFIKNAKRIRVIFQTFIVTLPSLNSVGALLLLVLYIYSIMGVFLFADVMLQSNLTYDANFQGFGISFLTLIRMSAGETWDWIMADCIRAKSTVYQCDYSDFDYNKFAQNGGNTYNCGNPIAAIIYFIGFNLVVPNVFLNLFIAIILEGYETTSEAMRSLIPEEHLENFVKCWERYDPYGKGFIKLSDLPHLLFELKDPLGWEDSKFRSNTQLQDQFLEELHISTYNNFQDVLFWDVVQGLSKVYFVKIEMKENIRMKLKEMEEDLSITGEEDQLIEYLQDKMGPKNSEEQRNLKIHLRLELEFETIDEQMKDVMDVEILRQSEDELLLGYSHFRDQQYTTAHICAGRNIIKGIRELKNRKKDWLEQMTKQRLLKGVNMLMIRSQQDAKSRQQQTGNHVRFDLDNELALPEKDTWSEQQSNFKALKRGGPYDSIDTKEQW